MDCLSDALLIEAYEKAMELNLQEDFILMIEEEMNRRGIQLHMD
ncbi:MAG TPA: sporulation histidine kinase inhibitor Sda [Pseudogracilibacillus sp.]|nr:sporulation histidine kinase inhibitor Sda [Pseudogracilibacillus sp.]